MRQKHCAIRPHVPAGLGFRQGQVLTSVPLGVEYRFTDLVRTLEKPVGALFDWTLAHGKKMQAARAAHGKGGALKK